MGWPRAILSFVAFLVCATLATAAQAERRVALVIGNSDYRHVSRLPNPVNDAAAMAALFRNAGFDSVELRQDLGIGDLRRVMRDFAEVARDADIAVLYYAGHGMEANGNNYLIPVDAKLASDFDVEDETFPLERALKVLEPARRLRLVILDACRDNPFVRSMKRSMGTRAVGRGLAAVEPTASDTLIAFAAKAGSVAADGEGANSPFTAALVKYIASPGLDLRIAFGQVRDAVRVSTRGAQEPFVYGSLGGGVVSLVGPDEAPSRTGRDPDGSAEAEAAYWEALTRNSPDVYEALLRRFPNHPRRAAIDKLLARSYDQRMWDRVRAQNSIPGYEQYKIAFPDGIYVAEANRRIADLHAEPERNSTPRQSKAPEETPSGPVARRPSYWDHNNSVVYLEADGSTRKFFYERPRPGMRSMGAQRGSLLFEGSRIQNSYSGTAYIFVGKCGKFPYMVSGRVLSEHEILMTGKAPRVDRTTCRIMGYKDDELLFTHRSTE